MARSRAISSLRSRNQAPASLKVMLVQSPSDGRSDLHDLLERRGFPVVAKSTVSEALSCLAGEPFAALVCDLHLPAAGDGFTLVNAMRHLHPDAVTMILSDYPALKESLSALLPQADEVLVTPLPLQDIVKLLNDRLNDPRPRVLRVPEPVATVLERHSSSTIKEWLARVNKNKNLTRVKLSDGERTGHLHNLLGELIQRLRIPRMDEGKAVISAAALAHGNVRKHQGYTAAMLVEESRILQVCIFKTLRSNLSAVDVALVLTDVMTIADEVDSQLTQTMNCFSKPKKSSVSVAALSLEA